MVDGIYYSCQGESHKATDKPCQDYSHCYATSNGIAVAIVCDGHGGERYFRSQYGAQFAAELTENAVWSFVQNVDASLFKGKKYTAEGPILPDKGDTEKPTNKEFIVFRQLFSNILYKWNEKINEHAEAHPINEWERKHVKEKYLNEFKSQMAMDREQRTILEKTYGCTLMTYVQTPIYWFAFHLGDGKMIAYKINNGKVQWKEPVPWDDRCFLNKTTSLCDSDALNEFRYCYEGDGDFPVAVFLGSDGLDDSFGEETNLVNFYIQVIKMLANDGIEATRKSLEETLPQLSKIGSKDDMSVATIFNLSKLKDNVQLFVDWQRGLVASRIDEINNRIDGLKAKRDKIKKSGKKDNNSVIELNYAIKDIERARADRADLIKKYDRLADELGDSHYSLSDNDVEIEDNIPSNENEVQPEDVKVVDASSKGEIKQIEEEKPLAEATISSENTDKQQVDEANVEDVASDTPKGDIIPEKEVKPYPRNIPVTGDSKEEKVDNT